MGMKYKLLIYIGRLEPLHNGHLKIIENGLKRAERVLVLIGSARSPRTVKNPFNYEERKAMVLGAVSDPSRVIVDPITDYPYNNPIWLRQVQNVVKRYCKDDSQIGIIGYKKDKETTTYLTDFPQWSIEEVPSYRYIDTVSNEPTVLDATLIRKKLFSPGWYDNGVSLSLLDHLPPNVNDFLNKFEETREYASLRNQQAYYEKYWNDWGAAPYAPTFVTVDAVLHQSGHVLVVERKAEPGKGLLALPGGFLNPKETIVKGMLRELREETKIKVPEPVLEGSIKGTRYFDHPSRSIRGRTITHAFLIDLKGQKELPRVKGADDAKKAFWLPLNELHEELFFEDHYHIIKTMLGEL